MEIRFHESYSTGKELQYLSQAIQKKHLQGDGSFTKDVQKFLESTFHFPKALLTSSCTTALEMAAILLDLKAGDEVIMPSFTFVSTANAFVLRGLTPVFVDCRPDTLNLDETRIEAAMTRRTKAIVPVHYAGVACEMDRIRELAKTHGLFVVEDAAQAIGAKYRNSYLGTLSDLGCLSFHDTKNISAGEGGALIVNNASFLERSEIIREKGTDRSRFIRKEVDKYTWLDTGSSFLPSELQSAYLLAQLENYAEINAKRMLVWDSYHRQLEPYEREGLLTRPTIPAGCEHNAHIYYVLLDSLELRTKVMGHLRDHKIQGSSHYIALHNSPGGMKFGRSDSSLPVTERVCDTILRLPILPSYPLSYTEQVISVLVEAIQKHK